MTSRDDTKAFSADLIDVFGETAVYTGQFGPYEIPAVFDDEYNAVRLEMGSVDATGPRAEVKTTDAEDMRQGDTLEVGGAVYKITDIQPDIYGVTTLILSKD